MPKLGEDALRPIRTHLDTENIQTSAVQGLQWLLMNTGSFGLQSQCYTFILMSLKIAHSLVYLDVVKALK